MMKKTLFLLVCAACSCLAGCQRQNGYGNYLGESSLGLVNDAAARIAALYPPASTRFAVAVEPDENDTFGLGLVGKLREAGYAIHEAGAEPHPDALSLAYLVDEFEGQVRVVVHLGDGALSRVYDVDPSSGVFIPCGGWAWRLWEGGA